MTQINHFDTLAHRLLDELDARHDELLSELEVLNQRVESVLSQYVTVRRDETPAVTVHIDDEDEDLDD